MCTDLEIDITSLDEKNGDVHTESTLSEITLCSNIVLP